MWCTYFWIISLNRTWSKSFEKPIISYSRRKKIKKGKNWSILAIKDKAIWNTSMGLSKRCWCHQRIRLFSRKNRQKHINNKNQISFRSHHKKGKNMEVDYRIFSASKNHAKNRNLKAHQQRNDKEKNRMI